MRSALKTIAAAGSLSFIGLGIVLYHAAGAQAGRPPQGPGGPGGGMSPQMMQMMQQRMQQMQKAREQMQKLDAEIDGLVAAMNKASGQKKVDAMAAVINKLVQERRLQRQMMGPPPGMGMGMPGGMGMRPGMMGGPGGPGGPPAGGGRRGR